MAVPPQLSLDYWLITFLISKTRAEPIEQLSADLSRLPQTQTLSMQP